MAKDINSHSGYRDEGAGMLLPAERVRLEPDDLFADAAAPEAGPLRPTFPVRRLLQQYWLIAGVFVLIAGPAMAAIWMLGAPEYRARATIEISPSNPRILYKTEDNGLIPMYQQYLNSQVGIIGGNKVLQRVIERKDVQATTWYREPEWKMLGSATSPLERLRKGLEVMPRGRTFLVDIDFVAGVPSDARVIVDAVLEEYKSEASSRVKDTDLMVLGTLEKTLDDLQVLISGREQVVEQLRREIGTSTPQDLIAQKRLRLDELEAQLESVDRELQLARWKQEHLAQTVKRLYDEQAAAQADGTSVSVDDEAHTRRRLESDGEWWRLYLSLQDTELQLKTDGQRLGQQHPRLVTLREQVQEIKGRLDARAAEVLERPEDVVAAVTDSPVTGPTEESVLTARVLSLEKEKELLQKSFDEQQDRFAVEFSKARQLSKETEELLKEKSKADVVRSRLDEKETERGPVALIKEVSRPLTPSRPYRDRRPVWSGLAALAGLASGLTLAFARVMLNPTIHEAGQLAATVPTPFLGRLPLVKPAVLGLQEINAAEEEHYRMLRTALLSRLAGQAGQITLITSSGPGVGKTRVAIKLAQSLARCGRRTLLVDTDVRAPGVSKRLGLRAEPGLMDVLRGRASDDDAITVTEVPGLDVLAAGRSETGHELELLANGVFSACLERWRARYDLVLLDGAPVLPVADARILSRHADSTILVVREGHCRPAEIRDTLACLGVSGGKLLGTVYIGAQPDRHYQGYAYAGYGAPTQTRLLDLDADQN